ncbi:MAG: M56 family metallopeptidase [Acidobacteriota bacterium]
MSLPGAGPIEAAVLAVLLEQVVKGAILLAAAWLASSLLRSRASAAMRGHLWTAALAGLLLLLPLSLALPALEVPMAGPLAHLAPFAAPAPHADADPMAAGRRPAEHGAPAMVPSAAPLADAARSGGPSGASQSAAAGLSGWGLAAWVWLSGAALLLARLALSSIRAGLEVRRAVSVTQPELLEDIRRLSDELGLRARVRAVSSERWSTPMAWGLVRPTILLPAASRGWTPERRRVVLLHELAHLVRRDCLALLVARAAQALHWPNPLTWLAVRRLRAEREQACDDLVLRSGTPGPDYAQHLLEIARSVKRSIEPDWATVAMARPSELEGRLLAILDSSLSRESAAPRRVWVAASACFAALLLPLASAQPGASGSPPSAPVEPDAAAADAAAAAADRSDAAPAAADLEAARSRALPALLRALEDQDPEVRVQTARALGRLQSRRALEPLMRAVTRDASREVRRASAWALGMIEDAAATPALIVALAEADSDVRLRSAWALGMIEDASAAPALVEALADPDPKLRRRAAWALGMIESVEGVEALLEALDADPDRETRTRSAWALGMIEDPSALDGLIAAVEDPDPELRERALWAIRQIAG